jgi:hypothetical protein
LVQESRGLQESITDHFEPLYRYDKGFRKCLTKLRKTLYQTSQVDDPDLEDDLDQNDNKVTEGADPIKEGLFRQCMKDIDDYLGETKGCDEMEQIDKWRAAKGTNGRGARMQREEDEVEEDGEGGEGEEDEGEEDEGEEDEGEEDEGEEDEGEEDEGEEDEGEVVPGQ